MTRLERIATKAARELRTQAGGESSVSVESLCKTLGITLHTKVMPPELDGFAFKSSIGCEHIVLNVHPNKRLGRVTFTSGHELAHLLIAREITFTEEYFFDTAVTVKTPLERACNLFAAELLMPADLIVGWFHDLRYNQKYRVQLIAERCGVTEIAVRVRLDQLKLIKHNKVGDYYS
jgi:Zn-dependent peptidase ImmA (M78 family)